VLGGVVVEVLAGAGEVDPQHLGVGAGPHQLAGHLSLVLATTSRGGAAYAVADCFYYDLVPAALLILCVGLSL